MLFTLLAHPSASDEPSFNGKAMVIDEAFLQADTALKRYSLRIRRTLFSQARKHAAE